MDDKIAILSTHSGTSGFDSIFTRMFDSVIVSDFIPNFLDLKAQLVQPLGNGWDKSSWKRIDWEIGEEYFEIHVPDAKESMFLGYRFLLVFDRLSFIRDGESLGTYSVDPITGNRNTYHTVSGVQTYFDYILIENKTRKVVTCGQSKGAGSFLGALNDAAWIRSIKNALSKSMSQISFYRSSSL